MSIELPPLTLTEAAKPTSCGTLGLEPAWLTCMYPSSIRDESSTALRLVALSRYPLDGNVAQALPTLMAQNDQLRPLWEKASRTDINLIDAYSATEFKILRAFFDYIYFASDKFQSTARNRRL